MNFFPIDDFDTDLPFNYRGVCFDPVNGAGNVPMGHDMAYNGLVVFMPPDNFAKLAAHLPKARSSEAFFRRTLSQGDFCIALPRLEIDTNKAHRATKVVGHEGRHRARALKKLGFDLIPVFVTVGRNVGLRARHLTEESLDDLFTFSIRNEDGDAHVRLGGLFLIWHRRVYVITQGRDIKDKAKRWFAERPVPIETVQRLDEKKRSFSAPRANPLPCRIVSLNEESFDWEGQRDYWDIVAEAEKLFSEQNIRLMRDEQIYEVCLDDQERVVGASSLQQKGEDEGTGQPAIRFSLVVSPSHRREGVARALTGSLLEAYPADEFMAEAWVVNPHMVGFLEGFGFVPEEGEWSPSTPFLRRER